LEISDELSRNAQVSKNQQLMSEDLDELYLSESLRSSLRVAPRLRGLCRRSLRAAK